MVWSFSLSSLSSSIRYRSPQEDVKSLTAHIVENYWKSLEDVDYVQTFKGLKLRYEQQRERQDNPKLDRFIYCFCVYLLSCVHCFYYVLQNELHLWDKKDHSKTEGEG